MKRKTLSYYFAKIKSALDKQDYNKAKRYGEIAVKKLFILSYSPHEEYLLYSNLGAIYYTLTEFTRSLDMYYKAYLTALKNYLEPEYIAFTSFMLGSNFLSMRNISDALHQFQKVEQYYQKYGDNKLPMTKERYINTFVALGFCYLYKREPGKTQEIIQKKLLSYQPFLSEGLRLKDYQHLKGEYLMAINEYDQARQSFQECIELSEQSGFIWGALQSRIHLAAIDLLEGQPNMAIHILQTVLKDARRLRFNDLICESCLLLSKCYMIKDMPDKSVSIEKRVIPILNKLDIVWLYEKTHEFEKLYHQLQPIYQTKTKPIHKVLAYTLNQYYETSFNKHIIGKSAPLIEVFQIIEKVAPTDLPVLIQGETGTGKELIAHAIHNNSLRKEKTWLATNCGAIPETLLENELFGHTKGAFTDAHQDKKGYIELASNGTLFLDEIAEMSPAMQQKLLRVLEDKLIWRLGAEKSIMVNTRFIFASNQDIETLVKQKRFRIDLLHRINTIVINVPPLRERKEDILLLVDYFLKKYFPSRHSDPAKPGKESLPEISSSALALLLDYLWPGNIRELENEIKRIYALYPDAKIITELMLSETIRNHVSPISADDKKKSNLKSIKEMTEKNLIIKGLKEYNGNISQVARQLGCSRLHLYRKISKFDIPLK